VGSSWPSGSVNSNMNSRNLPMAEGQRGIAGWDMADYPGRTVVGGPSVDGQEQHTTFCGVENTERPGCRGIPGGSA
ncbi:MAG: hypothetical protein ACK524_12625, partial [Planctomyces sp.]